MQAPDERLAYARCLDWGTRIGLGVLAAAFFSYAFGLVEPVVPLQELATVWSLPLERYLAITGAPTGWGWLASLRKGESLCLLGIALLALVTVVCYLRNAISALGSGERLQAGIALVQVLVLLLAASGVLTGGH